MKLRTLSTPQRSHRARTGALSLLRTRRLRAVAGVGALALFASTLAATTLLAGPAQAAPGDAFPAADPLVFVAQGTPTILQSATSNGSGSTVFTPVGGASGIQYNAIGYNPADNYLYGLSNGAGTVAIPTNSLVRIGENGVVTRVGANTFSPSVIATFGPADGYFYGWATPGGVDSIQVINVATGVLVRNTPTTGARVVGNDLAYLGGYLWGATDALISRTDPVTGATVQFPNTFAAAAEPTGTAGAAWAYGNGNIGFSFNTTGNVYQVAIPNPAAATPTFTLVSRNPGPASGQNDGAASPGLPTDLSIVKTGPAALTPGGTITYTLTVTNNGPGNSSGYIVRDIVPAPLTNVATDDDACTVAGSDITCVGGPLANGASVTHTITASVPANVTEAVSNTATVTPNEEDPTPGNNTDTSTSGVPGMAIVKNAGIPVDVNANGLVDAGDTIQYSFDVTNTGDVEMTDVTVNDAKVGAVTCDPATLAPGASVTCEADAVYTVTAADVTAGAVNNTATSTGTTPDGDDVTSIPSTTTTPVTNAAPAIAVVKTADVATVTTAGQTVTYSFLVTNTGNVTLDDVEVADAGFSGTGELSAITCPAGAASLAPGADITCTATYVVTQADVDAGTLTNTATATGTPPEGTPPVSPPSETEVDLPPSPALTVDKTATPATASAVGDTIAYSFLVTNTGNVTIDEVAIDEGDFSGTGDLSAIDCPTGPLAPAGTVTCTATYVLTQADVDSGELSNSATAIGTPPTGPPVVSPPDEAVVEIPESAGITVVKTPDAASAEAIAVGQTVTYSFLVTNTGNVTLDDVEIVEGDFSGTGELSAIDCPAASLAPAATATCTATYVVTQADVDAGEITNSATAAGTPPSGTPLESDPSEAVVPAEAPEPALTIEKSASPATIAAVGDEITYTFVVTNTGNVTLTDVVVDEGEFSGTGELSEVVCPAASASLAPGASITCTAAYVATQADVDSGAITNAATAGGTPPDSPPIESPSDEVEVEIPATPSLTIVKSADSAAQLEYIVGQTITYSFLLTNTGNVTLTEVAVNEGDFSGSGELSAITCPAGAASLAPDAQVTCEATYVVTQADVDAGTITNTATGSGTPPSGDEIDSPPSDVAVPSTPANPELSMVKSASPTSASSVGDTITYSFLVTNTGNVTITDVVIDDTEFSGTGELSAITCPAAVASLPPTAQVTCTATYELTQADVDSGELTNTATAGGTPPDGPPIETPPDTVVVEVPPAPAITVVKSADEAAQAALVLGQTVTYSFRVTNTGNVSLTQIAVVEGEFTGTGELSAIDCPATALAPGEQFTCTATYVVTQADVDAGQVSNSATAGGTPPSGDPIESPPSEAVVPAPPAPGLSVVKTASSDKATTVGEILTYSFLVTNTGNVTISDVTIVEGTFTGTGILSAIDCGEGASSLAPGAQVSCFASYSVTQADINAGSISNTATASGTPPGGTPFGSDPSTAEVATPGPLLASTGFDSGWLAAVSLALLMLGGVLVASRAARRTEA